MKLSEENIFPWIGITSKMIDHYHSRKFKESGFELSKEQWVMLKVISENNGVSQNEIACVANRDKTTLTRLINTMEKKNFIARIPSVEDKRVNLIYLTTHGEKLFHEAGSLMKDLVENLNSGITNQEEKALIRIMKKIQNNINETNGC